MLSLISGTGKPTPLLFLRDNIKRILQSVSATFFFFAGVYKGLKDHTA